MRTARTKVLQLLVEVVIILILYAMFSTVQLCHLSASIENTA